MLIKKFFSTEAFLTISTPPFIYIYVNFVFFLIPEYIIVGMKPALFWELIVFSIKEWHQILQNRHKQHNIEAEVQNALLQVTLYDNDELKYYIPPQLFLRLPDFFLLSNVLHEHAHVRVHHVYMLEHIKLNMRLSCEATYDT